MLNLFQHLTASLYLPPLFLGEILKQVQDDICVLIAHRVPLKILYKTEFSYKSSWKVESAQLENFYFPVGELFFLSWKIEISQ